jgi:uncharacterized OB-fold protein
MPYLPSGAPSPQPNDDDAPYWANCRLQRLTFQRCSDCGSVTHPPLAVCPKCQSSNRGWIDAPADGVVFSFTWIHSSAHDAITSNVLPYNAAVIEFPSLPGVRLVSNVVDAHPDDLQIGDRVRLIWEADGADVPLPRFRKAP